MKIRTRLQLTGVLGLMVSIGAYAQIGGAQFSADISTKGGKAPEMTGKMYVGEGRMRTEMNQQGQHMVRIVDQENRKEIILFPDQKRYLERSAPPGTEVSTSSAAPSAETDPCTGVEGLTCRRVGEEDVGGRPAVKWEMMKEHEGKTLTGYQWLDKERGLPLKYQMPDGQSMELDMLGEETLDGRKVEKWEMTNTAPNRPPIKVEQWYDPQLKLSVREEQPNGFVSELTNIQVGAQPDSLFVIPEGYTRMEEPPARPMPGGAAPGPQR